MTTVNGQVQPLFPSSRDVIALTIQPLDVPVTTPRNSDVPSPLTIQPLDVPMTTPRNSDVPSSLTDNISPQNFSRISNLFLQNINSLGNSNAGANSEIPSIYPTHKSLIRSASMHSMASMSTIWKSPRSIGGQIFYPKNERVPLNFSSSKGLNLEKCRDEIKELKSTIIGSKLHSDAIRFITDTRSTISSRFFGTFIPKIIATGIIGTIICEVFGFTVNSLPIRILGSVTPLIYASFEGLITVRSAIESSMYRKHWIGIEKMREDYFNIIFDLITDNKDIVLNAEKFKDPSFKKEINDLKKIIEDDCTKAKNNGFISDLEKAENDLKKLYSEEKSEEKSEKKLKEIRNLRDQKIYMKSREFLKGKSDFEILNLVKYLDIDLLKAKEIKDFKKEDMIASSDYFNLIIGIYEAARNKTIKQPFLTITSFFKTVGLLAGAISMTIPGIGLITVAIGASLWVLGELLNFSASIPSYIMSGFRFLTIDRLKVLGLRDRWWNVQKIKYADYLFDKLKNAENFKIIELKSVGIENADADAVISRLKDNLKSVKKDSKTENELDYEEKMNFIDKVLLKDDDDDAVIKHNREKIMYILEKNVELPKPWYTRFIFKTDNMLRESMYRCVEQNNMRYEKNADLILYQIKQITTNLTKDSCDEISTKLNNSEKKSQEEQKYIEKYMDDASLSLHINEITSVLGVPSTELYKLIESQYKFYNLSEKLEKQVKDEKKQIKDIIIGSLNDSKLVDEYITNKKKMRSDIIEALRTKSSFSILYSS